MAQLKFPFVGPAPIITLIQHVISQAQPVAYQERAGATDPKLMTIFSTVFKTSENGFW